MTKENLDHLSEDGMYPPRVKVKDPRKEAMFICGTCGKNVLKEACECPLLKK